MRPKTFIRVCLFLLPYLLAQAFVPVGFMVEATEQGLAIGFCPVQSAATLKVLGLANAAQHPADHQGAHAHHHGSNASQDADETPRSGAACPYALKSVALTGAPAVSFFAVALIEVDSIGASPSLPPVESALFAPNRIRGPPPFVS